jgi:hypothetical protein
MPGQGRFARSVPADYRQEFAFPNLQGNFPQRLYRLSGGRLVAKKNIIKLNQQIQFK